MGYVRTLGAVAATGVVSMIVLKLLAAMAIPLMGMLFGALMTALKIGLVVAAVFFVYRMIQRRRERMESVS